jgi:hypothetical protein
MAMENLFQFHWDEIWKHLTTRASLFNLSLVMALAAMGLILCLSLTADAQGSYPFVSLNR